eukprot:376725_1
MEWQSNCFTRLHLILLHTANTNYHQDTNKCNNMTILQDTITMEKLLYALKKGITNAQNALNIAKMVSALINQQKNNGKQIVKRLTNEHIVNVLTNCIIKHSNNPQIIKECQYALNLMLKTLIVDTSDELAVNTTYTGTEESTYKCGKAYKHSCNFKANVKIHTDSIHVCKFCNKRFGRKYNYSEHVRVHTGQSPFQCNVCNKPFKQKHCLKNHFKKNHVNSC